MTQREEVAGGLALAVPVALLAGALISQYLGGLYPCEMCHWQRWPHYVAAVVALIAFLTRRRGIRRTCVILAAVLIAGSGAIGVFHAGVEYGWWQGVTTCSSTIDMTGTTSADRLAAIMRAPLIRCDVAQWRFAGISLAGYNAIFSIGAAVIILALMRKPA